MSPKGFFMGAEKMLEQAQRQFRIAQGGPLRWIVAEEKLARALRKLFSNNGLDDIEVIHIRQAD
jgi:NADPH-dependent ferric siderophore reductase